MHTRRHDAAGVLLHPVVESVMVILRERPSEPWTVGAVANLVGRDRCYLSRLFKRETGHTIRQFLLHQRLGHAESLIHRGEKIEVAALLAGFRSRRHFNQLFKRCHGTTPSEFRRRRTGAA